MDRKLDQIEKKEETIHEKDRQISEKLEEAEIIKKSQIDQLERISGYTASQAKEQLLESLEGELAHEKAIKIANYELQLKDEAEEKAREIISLAITRCAADHVSEATVSVVNLPNDEMKGRIIGREGRNIRTLETLTGVDLIIDDTPEAITLSCFDPVAPGSRPYRPGAVDCRWKNPSHPHRGSGGKGRNGKWSKRWKAEGERAMMETGVHGIHHELVKLLGRLCYRTSYGQNVFGSLYRGFPLGGGLWRRSLASTLC